MPFKAVDIIGISVLIDYEAMFKQAGVDVDLDVNPCPFGATGADIIAAVGDADAVIAQATFQTFSRAWASAARTSMLKRPPNSVFWPLTCRMPAPGRSPTTRWLLSWRVPEGSYV